MTVGIILLFVVGLAIYIGAAQRVLDRLYLKDSIALLFVVLIIVGSFFELTISRTPLLTINFGGAFIPVILCIYVISRIDTVRELVRTVIAVMLTATAIYGISLLFQNFGHGRDVIDPMYIFAFSGGIIAYVLGKSRRGSFIAGTLGYLLFNLSTFFRALVGTVNAQVRLGGAGAFDSIVISGLLALLVAELIGESRERLAGGPAKEK
ncbi:MAG: DUF1614 domain-containing protein [Bacillota bacterium]